MVFRSKVNVKNILQTGNCYRTIQHATKVALRQMKDCLTTELPGVIFHGVHRFYPEKLCAFTLCFPARPAGGSVVIRC
jgi:hypothetical protein